MTESTKYWLWLTTMEGMTYEKVSQLIRRFGLPQAIYEAGKQDFEGIPVVTEPILAGLLDKSLSRVEELLAECERKSISVMTVDDAQYPQKLRDIATNPYVLYYAGNWIDVDEILTVGVVGARKASAYGLECADKLSGELSRRGALIVSGMAEGIDGAANRAALKAGSPTIAVLGCGLDVVYPKFHKDLMMQILRRGLLISEYPPGTRPLRYHFPARNRIISGLSNGLIVVEAAKKSGSRITVDFALEQGRDVFIVPGSIFSPNSVGVLNLLQDGAIPVTCAQDVLDEFPQYHPQMPEQQEASSQETVGDARQESALSGSEDSAEKSEDRNLQIEHIIDTDEKYAHLSAEDKAILKCMHYKPESFDAICTRSGVAASELSAKLSMLCMMDLCEQHPFGRFSLK